MYNMLGSLFHDHGLFLVLFAVAVDKTGPIFCK
jgi:hypothetical protein